MRATTVRFSDALWTLVEREANREGVSAAQYIRDAAVLRTAYTMGQRGDAELLARAVAGDARAFSLVHDRHAAHAYAAARRILGATPAAEDAVQDAFLQLWRDGGRYSAQRGPLRSWIVVLVRSRALDLLRRERVRTAASEKAIALGRLSGVAAPADEVAGAREGVRAVCSGLAALPREQAEVLGLMMLGGRSQSEVARARKVPLGTVKGRSRLGLQRLRRTLSEPVPA